MFETHSCVNSHIHTHIHMHTHSLTHMHIHAETCFVPDLEICVNFNTCASGDGEVRHSLCKFVCERERKCV